MVKTHHKTCSNNTHSECWVSVKLSSLYGEMLVTMGLGERPGAGGSTKKRPERRRPFAPCLPAITPHPQLVEHGRRRLSSAE